MSAVAKVGHDPKIIARLQSDASRKPGLFRFQLATIAIAADFALTLTRVLPLVAPIVLGMIFFDQATFYWLGGAAIVLFTWLLRPTFRFEGRELTLAQSPRLHEAIETLKQSLRVPGRMRVYLDGSFNASATETRGLFGVFGTRCSLTLGVPLLMALNQQQVLAVIGHELGHFSRRHGRLGHWLYRARVGWMQYAQDTDEADSSFGQAATWYAKKFIPFFSARSFVHSRQCEYEADADAALAVGRQAFGEALTRVAVIGQLWDEDFPRALQGWQLQSPEPPDDFYQRFGAFVMACAPNALQSRLTDALRAPSSWHDTHPSLSERLSALGQSPVLVTAAQHTADSPFVQNWESVLAEFNGKWAEDVRADWLIEHLRLKHVVQGVLAADAASARGWSLDRRLLRAQALREAEPDRGLAELRALHAQDPSHNRIKFAYAAALLHENDESGVKLMESLAREDAAFRAPAFLRVLSYFERKGDERNTERWSSWFKLASGNLSEAVSSFIVKAHAGQGRPSSLPTHAQAAISEAVRLDTSVAQAWLLEGDGELHFATDRPATPLAMHLLVLAIDPVATRRALPDEDGIAQRYQDLLRMLIPADQTPVVQTYFTTEAIPAGYRLRADLSLKTDARDTAPCAV